jgi:hypothetical protein
MMTGMTVHDEESITVRVNGQPRTLGAVGVSAAIANAVFHATAVRVRELPSTIDRLLS